MSDKLQRKAYICLLINEGKLWAIVNCLCYLVTDT